LPVAAAEVSQLTSVREVAVPAIVVQLDPGTPILGVWCNACMTSGGFRMPLNRISWYGVSTIATAVGCFTCEGPGDLEP
jgi:hypothetical protein